MKIDPACMACGGTGRNSRGNACSPCQVRGFPSWVLKRVEPDWEAAAKMPGVEVVEVEVPTTDPALEGFV